MKWPTVHLKEEENPWITYFKRQVYRKNNCINLVATGKPGCGKSWAILSAFCLIDPDFNIQEQCFFKASKLMRAFEKNKIIKGKPFLFDEAGIDANNLKWQDEINRGLNAFFQTARHRNYIFGSTVPYLSFLSKGVRTLMNCHWRADGWTTDNFTKVRAFILEYNGDMDKFYRKRLMVKTKTGMDYCNEVRMPKPPKHIVEEYEKIKKEFTTDLFRNIGNKIDAFERERDSSHLTCAQERVENRFEIPRTIKEVAELENCCEDNIYEIMKSMEKKGIKFQRIKEKHSTTVRYMVNRGGQVP